MSSQDVIAIWGLPDESHASQSEGSKPVVQWVYRDYGAQLYFVYLNEDGKVVAVQK